MNEVLSLDIGGTNSRIAKINVINGVPILKKEKVVLTKDIKSVSQFIKGYGSDATSCGIGFAGPIIGGRSRLTNANLYIDISKLKKETGLKKVFLMNDFHANAFGLKFLDKKDLLVINNSKGLPNNDVQMVVGPGTGLGKAYFMNKRVYPCEGGLTNVGIEDIDDYSLVDYIKHKVKSDVYYEDIVSGRGLLDIYDYLEIKSNLALNMKLRKQIKEEPVHKAKLLVKYCRKDKLCDMTLKIFTKFYARFVRNSALNLISSEVYLVGGITEAISPYLKKYFNKEFTNHRIYSSLLSKIKVYVVKRQDLGLIGAGAAAAGLV